MNHNGFFPHPFIKIFPGHLWNNDNNVKFKNEKRMYGRIRVTDFFHKKSLVLTCLTLNNKPETKKKNGIWKE